MQVILGNCQSIDSSGGQQFTQGRTVEHTELGIEGRWGARWCKHRAVTHTGEGVDMGILKTAGDGLAIELGRDRVVAQP